MQAKNPQPIIATDETLVRPVAVIDVGTTLIRMAIAEIDQDGNVRILERLSQVVNLGKDTFTRGSIRKSTIEDCVRVLKSYRQLLREYQIEDPEQIRVVATSAVREAQNKFAFLDRIYIATGIEVEPIDEAEVNRITYLGIEPFLKSSTELYEAKSIVVEVGGGSTELLMVHQGDVVYSHVYRLGSLRLRETLETYRAPQLQARNIMANQIQRTVDQICQHVPESGPMELVALGGDIRFAASEILPDWSPTQLGKMSIDDLEEFTESVLVLSEDDLVQKYRLSFTDAESLAPALLAYVTLAKSLGLQHILVSTVNLRDGLLQDMADQGAWTEDFSNQIVRSAVDLGKKFQVDEPHALHVAELSKSLFDSMQVEHQLEPIYKQILYVGALLHELGMYVSTSGFHKHSQYLISNSELFGLGRKELLLTALVARYHRRASPKPTHEGYIDLNRSDRIAVSKMAALLRVADALDRSHSQRVNEIQCSRKDSLLIVSIPHVEDLSLEQLALKQKGSLFEDVFGMQIRLVKTRN